MNPAIFDRPSGIGALLGPGDIATPTAGYSLRPLSIKSYGRPVVEVRRSSDNAQKDFTPSEITDGTLLAWVGTTASDHGHVTTWYDQSGNSNDATQTNASEQPKIVDAGVLVTDNGKPALDFDGVDDFFIIPDFSHSTTLLCTTIVQNPDSVLTEFMFAHLRTDNNQRSFAVRFLGNSYGYQTSSNGTAFTILNSNQSTSSQTVYFSQYDGSQTGLNRVKGYVNGSQITYSENLISTESLPSSVHNSTADFTIGAFLLAASTGSGNYDGNMQELIFYDTDQSANRTAIEDNINNYYDIY